MRKLAALLALLLVAGQAQAAESLLVTKKSLSSAAARALVDACLRYATEHRQIVAAAVVDAEGTLIELHAMQGATVTNIESAPLKAKTSLRWRRSTKEIGDRVKSGENEAPVWLHDFPQRGAVPIFVDGDLIGAMGIGGAGSDECAVAAVKEVFGGAAKTAGP
jgi:glc operon protein GlcG